MCILGEDASCFSAKSVEQYYGWNIGKRRAAEVIPCLLQATTESLLEKITKTHVHSGCFHKPRHMEQ